MTAYQLKRRKYEMINQLKQLDITITKDNIYDLDEETKKVVLECLIIDFILDNRKNKLIHYLEYIWCLAVSQLLILSVQSLSLSLILITLNCLVLILLIRKSRELIQILEPTSLLLWVKSECGGNFPEWKRYCKNIKTQLLFNLFIFMVWLIAYIQLSPASVFLDSFSPIIMLCTLFFDYKRIVNIPFHIFYSIVRETIRFELKPHND